MSEITPGIIETRFHNLFADTNDTVTETLILTFRSQHLLESQLHAAGFEIEATYGTWTRTPFIEDSSLIIIAASAR